MPAPNMLIDKKNELRLEIPNVRCRLTHHLIPIAGILLWLVTGGGEHKWILAFWLSGVGFFA